MKTLDRLYLYLIRRDALRSEKTTLVYVPLPDMPEVNTKVDPQFLLAYKKSKLEITLSPRMIVESVRKIDGPTTYIINGSSMKTRVLAWHAVDRHPSHITMKEELAYFAVGGYNYNDCQRNIIASGMVSPYAFINERMQTKVALHLLKDNVSYEDKILAAKHSYRQTVRTADRVKDFMDEEENRPHGSTQ